jgi:hypothetical protein
MAIFQFKATTQEKKLPAQKHFSPAIHIGNEM